MSENPSATTFNPVSGMSERLCPLHSVRCRVGVLSSAENSQMQAFSIISELVSNSRRDSRVDSRVFILQDRRNEFARNWLSARNIAQMGFVFVSLRALKTAAPSTEGCYDLFTVKLAFDTLPAKDCFSDCGVHVCCAETAGFPNVGE